MNNKLINEEKIIVLSIIFLIEKNEEKSWNLMYILSTSIHKFFFHT